MTTQRKIADILDLSLGTISRALRDMPGIHPNTRARVMATAASMGYRPNLEAQSRRGEHNENQLIGLLIDVAPKACGNNGIFIPFPSGCQ